MLIDLNNFVKELYQRSDAKDMTLRNGTSFFLNHVKVNNRPDTFEYYKRHLGYVLDNLEKDNVFYFSQLNNAIIERSILNFKNKGNSNSTINKNIICFQTMTKYVHENELIDEPGFHFKRLKEEKPEVKTVDKNILKEINNYLKDKSPLRRLVFELMLTTGIRRSEITRIKRKDIDLEREVIWLSETKTGNPRYIFLTSNLKSLIETELKYKPSNEYLLVFEDGRRVTPNSIDTFFEEIKKELAIKVSPHKLRHTFATSILENGGNLEEVRLLLGHTSYEMTKRYLHIKEKELKDCSIKMNPLTRL